MSEITRWFPFGRLDRVGALTPRREDPLVRMEREMSEFMQSMWPETKTARFSPHIDVLDEDDHITLTADVPGVSKEDLEITVGENVVTLSGERRYGGETADKGYYRSERYYGTFYRAIPLPTQVNAEAVEAKLEDGVLVMTIPKMEQQKRAKRILLE